MDAIRSYSELIKIPTFEERYFYLKLSGIIGDETFGFDRYMNQLFYRSPEWRRIRREIVIRDNGCDLGIESEPIIGQIYVHHMNPINSDDIKNRSSRLFDPENLISVSYNTHQAITYGLDHLIRRENIERAPNDTCPWRKQNVLQ